MDGWEQMNPKPTIFDELTPTELEGVEQAHEEQLLTLSSTGYPQASRSASGFTLDTYIIVNSVSVPVRSLWNAGILGIRTNTTTEGTGLALHTVSLYEAYFLDRNRSFVITEETYRALNEHIEPNNEVPSELQQQHINTSIEPLVQDRLSSRENPNDARGKPKRYSEDTRFPAGDVVEAGDD
jgi:hypothetical protein